jgi:hypothetical protein
LHDRVRDGNGWTPLAGSHPPALNRSRDITTTDRRTKKKASTD